jgi:hypothetical protein
MGLVDPGILPDLFDRWISFLCERRRWAKRSILGETQNPHVGLNFVFVQGFHSRLANTITFKIGKESLCPFSKRTYAE